MEVETKARVKDLNAIKGRLESLGAKFSRTVEQHDSYFKQKGFDAKPEGPGAWIIRIRASEGKTTLTMKVLTELLGAWKEFETEIENEAQLRKMLEAIGLQNVFNFNKKRTYGAIEDFELCLDDVRELGLFLEASLESEDSEAARNRIISFLKKIGIKEEDLERRGYGEIMGEKLGHKFEGMR